MPYDIFGFVETRPPVPGPWLSAFSVSEKVGQPDDFSNKIFGLSKFGQEDAPLGNRGLPVDVSLEISDWTASIARFELEEGANCGDHGHTYATLEEMKKINVPPGSAWQSVLTKIDELQRDFGYLDSEIRVVLWANW